MNTSKLQSLFTGAQLAWLIPLADEMPKWGIDTPIEQCSFLSQVGAESAGMTKFDENLDYSASRLVQVWPSRFFIPSDDQPKHAKKRSAFEYAHNPQKLAEFCYGGRMGNGPEGSGDGWMFRGGGPGHTTGRKNYEASAKGIGYDLIAQPNHIRTVPLIGCRAVCFFWRAGGFDRLDDDNDIRAESHKWNGGDTGREDRQRWFDRARAIAGIAA